MNNGSFIKFMRSTNARELMKCPKSFILLAQIAQRARRNGELNIQNLRSGEALIGDYKSIGLTEQEYRTAKKNLEKLRIATFRGTTKGTVACLTDNTIFDINVEKSNVQANRQTTSKQRTGNGHRV